MSRRFIFGSLICLSDDGFKNNFIFGTVVDRDGIDGGGRHQQQQPKNRRFTIEKRGCIGVLLQSMTAASELRQDIAYYLVESPAFYECYSHVLRALQVGSLFYCFIFTSLDSLPHFREIFYFFLTITSQYIKSGISI